ncbi:MAG: anthranilate synthase component I family protein [Bacteroidales bacterium]
MNYKIKTRSQALLADLQTPVSLYLKVRDIFPESALLESTDFHVVDNRYSFIAVKPLAKFVVEKGVVTEQYPDGKINKIQLEEDTFLPELLENFVKEFDVKNDNNPTGINGFFGYTGYDAVQHFENVKIRKAAVESSDAPEMVYILYKYIIVVNHFKNEMVIVENIPAGDKSEMDEIVAMLDSRNFPIYPFEAKGEITSPITDDEYMEMVDKGIKHCKRGDVFQIVLSRRFEQQYKGDDFNVYRALRSVNPSPYLFYFDFGSFRIFGSSPETHLKMEGDKATIDPIAGTFRRTGDDKKDELLAEQLLLDPKENAEHVMLVDLARNDLSRNCSDVHVESYKEIQFYSHVIHMVSRVSGTIFPEANRIKLFADTFPAGTLSGAPKVSAMQLIDNIEKHARGFYGGCIGYIGFNGDFNQAITIRSFLSKNNTLHFQAGAGIVSKSIRENELQEVNNKLGALNKAVVLASTIK